MSRRRTIIRLSAVLASLALGWACGGDSATAPPTPEPARPTTVTVSPATHGLTALGATVQLSAEVRDQNARVMAGATVIWTSSAISVATVDASGLVTAAGNGTATITASAGSASGSAVVTVTQSVESVVVSPSEETIALGNTLQLTAEAFDESGHAVAEVEFSWESSDAAVATVDASGLVTGVAVGVATITASAGEVAGSAVVTVMQPVASVEVSPSAETIGLGSTLQLIAEAFDENGNAVAGAEFSWASSDEAVATVASGLVTGVAVGVTTITARAGSTQGTAEITVENPDRATLVALYSATDGPNWQYNTNWLTDAPLGEWYGVNTDATGRVVQLHLEDNALTGPIPPELGNLAKLTSLELWVNSLSGPIPPELGNLAKLTSLELWVNSLSGPIPPELGNLANLEQLGFGGNSLSGLIPPELGNLANLEQLRLDGNALSGPIPPELGNLANLEVLRLTFNALTGPIPPELARLARLRELGLRGNRGLCLPADPQFLAWLAERFSFSFFPCEFPGGRLLPSALMREDGNGLSLALPDDLRNPTAVMVSDPSVVAASAVGGWLELSPRGRGSAEVKVTSSGGGDPAIARIAVRAAVGTFGIDMVLEQPAPTGYEETLVTIADWWSSVLDGTEWPDRPMTCYGDRMKAQVDDMLIYALTYYRNSPTDATGYANSCRPQSGFPIGGVLGMAYGFGHFRQVMAHEIGHHLGLVGIWPSHLVTKDRKYFIGARAVEAYRAAGGDASLPGVPLSEDGVHWGPGVNDWPLTGVISLAALVDAGYTVDTTKTRPIGRSQTVAPLLVDDLVLVGPTAAGRPR